MKLDSPEILRAYKGRNLDGNKRIGGVYRSNGRYAAAPVKLVENYFTQYGGDFSGYTWGKFLDSFIDYQSVNSRRSKSINVDAPLLHEIGHLVDFYLRENAKNWRSAIRTAFRNDPNKPSEYGSTDYTEYMARRSCSLVCRWLWEP